LLFSFALCISSFVSARQCYVTPCYEGKGLETLWSVDGGLSFQLVCMALASFAQVFISYWVLFRTVGEMKKGLLIGFTGVLSLFLLIQAVFWGQESIMVMSLDSHLNGYQYYQDSAECNVSFQSDCVDVAHKGCVWVKAYGACQRAMDVDDTAKAKFDAVTVFSVLLSLTQAAFCFIVHSWLNDSMSVPSYPKRAQAPTTKFQTTTSSSPNPQDDEQMGSSYQTENVRL